MYEITIKKIDKVEYYKTDTRYVNKNTGKPCDYDDPEKVNERYETGDLVVREDTQIVFVQRKEDLDVDQIAVFINNKK